MMRCLSPVRFMARTAFFAGLCLLLTAMTRLPSVCMAGEPVSHPAAAGNGLVVTDARGKEVKLHGLPQRIVITGKASFMVVDAVYLFPAAWSRVAGLNKEGMGSGGQGMDAFLAAIDPGYAGKTTLGREAGPEQIAAAKPDVVLMKKASTENLGRSLEEIGIPVVCVDFETPEQYDRDLAILGRLLGQEARAKEIAEFIHGRLSRIDNKLAAIDEGKKPTVLLLYYSSRDGSIAYNVPPKSWIQTILVKMAGGRPLWDGIELGQGWTKVGFEQIAAWNPDQIFVVSYFVEYGKIMKDLLSDERWQALRAVKSKQIWSFPGDMLSWDQPDPRWILGLEWLASKIHPDLFPGVDMKAEVVGFFRDFYGVDADAVKKGILPTLHGDL